MRDHYIALSDEIEALKKNNWQLMPYLKTEPNAQLKIKKQLIAGKSPIKNIATFARKLAEGQQNILLSIDKKL